MEQIEKTEKGDETKDVARASERIPHAMGIDETTRRDLGSRLARIRGQVEGLSRMVEKERYCPDILQQFAAVHSALRAAESRLLASHLEGCATRAINEGGDSAADARREIVELFHRYLT